MKRTPSVWLAVSLGALATACSLTIDRNVVQCTTDADCVNFESDTVTHAVCSNSVCINSGLGPRGCFSGAPTTEAEYLNACTSAQYKHFDNCGRLGLCGATPLPDPVAPPQTVTTTASITVAPVPAVKCADAGANLIYMTGAGDFGPLLKAVTPILAANNPPYRAIFVNGSSCSGVSSIFSPAASLIKDVTGSTTKASNYAFYYDDAGNQVSCTLDPNGNTVDIGVSDLYSTVCDPTFVTSETIGGYTGPVVPFVFIAPAASKEEVISAEAAHIVFGLGGQNPTGRAADPWTNPTYFFIRNAGAASIALTAEMIRVPRGQFWGIDRQSTDGLRDSLQMSAAIDPAIGIISIDYAEKSRGNIKTLHLQASGQAAGFLPDSTRTAFDKTNVRDGHYPLWGYVHFYTKLSETGVPSTAAGTFVTRFSVPRLDQALIDAIIDASLVPQCAMSVARTTELGPYSTNPNSFECRCYFELRATGRTTCNACRNAAECPASTPACNYGFCEKK